MNIDFLEQLHSQLQYRASCATTFIVQLWRENPTSLLLIALLMVPFLHNISGFSEASHLSILIVLCIVWLNHAHWAGADVHGYSQD